MLNTLSFNNMFHSVSMSGFSIGSLHPYSVFVIVNLSISSSLLVSSYTVAKTSVYLMLYIVVYLKLYLNSFVYLVILLYFILYPLLFITLICTLYSINNNIVYSSICKGISLINIVLVFNMMLVSIIRYF
jgi:hypothetical protein